jgi:hypothetical protein
VRRSTEQRLKRYFAKSRRERWVCFHLRHDLGRCAEPGEKGVHDGCGLLHHPLSFSLVMVGLSSSSCMSCRLGGYALLDSPALSNLELAYESMRQLPLLDMRQTDWGNFSSAAYSRYPIGVPADSSSSGGKVLIMAAILANFVIVPGRRKNRLPARVVRNES